MNGKRCFTIILLVAVVLAFASSCDELDMYLEEGSFETYPEGETDMYGYYRPRLITPSQALARMQSYPDAIILDVRTQQEFDTGHIPGAILLPDYAVEAQAPYVLPDKDAMILIYCRSGNRSASAARLLVSMGYTNVYDFGGINSWPYEVE